MAYQKRTKKNGSSYYTFVLYDPRRGTNVRLSKEEIRKRFGRDVTTEEEAKEFQKLLEALHESESIRIQRRIEWKNKYYNFNDLMDQYEAWQKKEAPNSFKTNLTYMKHYVLRFFLTLQNLPNVDMWSDHFEAFRDWLEKDAFRLKGKKQLLSYNSKNHAISALNTFLIHLHSRNYLAKLKTCPSFPEHLTNKRSLDDVIQPGEAETIRDALIMHGCQDEADFYEFLYFTGMRFHEGLGVSLGDFFQGKLTDSIIGKALENNGIEYFGYVVVDSQFDFIRPDGTLKRAFLKGEKEISERTARTVPIIDKALWNRIVGRLAEQHALFKQGKFGVDKKNYILFRAVNINTGSARLKKAFAAAKLRYRSWHCLRHSRATFLIGQIKDTMVVRLWTGHKSLKVLERYNHIYQSVVREARSNANVSGDFGFKKV